MENRFQSYRNENPVQVQNKPRTRVDYSSHNLSRMNRMQVDYGVINVIDHRRVLLGERIHLTEDIAIKIRNPIVKQLWTGATVLVRAIYNNDSDLWEGADMHYTRALEGGSTTFSGLKVPAIRYNLPALDNNYHTKYFNTLYSLPDQMNRGCEVLCRSKYSFADVRQREPFSLSDLSSSEWAHNHVPPVGFEFSALPYVQYQRYWRDYVCNPNYLSSNKYWFPDNEDHFILPYNCTEANVMDYDSPFVRVSANIFQNVASPLDGSGFVPRNGMSSITTVSGVPAVTSANFPWLCAHRYQQIRGNRFSTSLPFPDFVRGDIPSINLTSLSGSIDWSKVVGPYDGSLGIRVLGNTGLGSDTLVQGYYNPVQGSIEPSPDDSVNLLATLNKATISGQINASLTMSALQQLNVWTLFKQKMGMAHMDYNSMMEAQFNERPKKHNRRAIIIGQSKQELVFSDIINTAKSEQADLGEIASRAQSTGHHDLGYFTAPDNGQVMVLMSIIPDIYDVSGIDRDDLATRPEEEFYPVLSRLPPQPIYRAEFATPTASESDNKDVVGYEEPFGHLKSRMDMGSGLFSLPDTLLGGNGSPVVNNVEDSQFLQRRIIPEKSEINNSYLYLSPSNIDRRAFTVPEEMPFNAIIVNGFFKVKSPVPAVYNPTTSLAQGV